MDKEEFPFFVFFVFRNERNVEESAHLREQNYLYFTIKIFFFLDLTVYKMPYHLKILNDVTLYIFLNL
jgi:hypothetical protein